MMVETIITRGLYQTFRTLGSGWSTLTDIARGAGVTRQTADRAIHTLTGAEIVETSSTYPKQFRLIAPNDHGRKLVDRIEAARDVFAAPG